MDIVTMALAKPKVVDMTQFAFVGGTINDLILMLAMQSMQENGAMQELELTDEDLKLRRALSTKRPLNLWMDDGGGRKSLIPVTNVTDDGVCVQVMAGEVMYLQGYIVDLRVILLFNADLESDALNVMVKCEVLTA